MRQLVLSHGNGIGPVSQDIRSLEQRIAQKAVIMNLFAFQFAQLLLEGGTAFQPGDGRDHAQEQKELGMFLDPGLAEKNRFLRIQAAAEPVDEHLPAVLADLAGLGVPGGERVPVGDKVIAQVLVLQLEPALQGADVVAQVQPPAGPRTADDGFHFLCIRLIFRHIFTPNIRLSPGSG